MFNNQHRVTKIAQPYQCRQKSVIIALMQPNGWLVQHIQHTGQARADLRGQSDTLGFAAGKRARITRHRQVIQANINQKAETLINFLQNARSDF